MGDEGRGGGCEMLVDGERGMALSHGGTYMSGHPAAASGGGVAHRRGLPRTGSIHAGLDRGARQLDLKSRFLKLMGTGYYAVANLDHAFLDEVAVDDECGGSGAAEQADRHRPAAGLDSQPGVYQKSHSLPSSPLRWPYRPLPQMPTANTDNDTAMLRDGRNDKSIVDALVTHGCQPRARKRAADGDDAAVFDLQSVRHKFKRFSLSNDLPLSSATLPTGPLPESMAL